MREEWLKNYTEKVLSVFGDRVAFVGIQGSVARGEATDGSDIDVVLILDKVSYADIKLYDKAISLLPDRKLICGFLSGRAELENWDGADLFQFYNDTVGLYGSLDFIRDSVNHRNAQKLMHKGACDIYHMCVHNAVHEKSPEILKNLYKSSAFILQAKIYLETGRYLKKREEFCGASEGEDRLIAENICRGRAGAEIYRDEFDDLSEKLILWTKDIIIKYRKDGGK